MLEVSMTKSQKTGDVSMTILGVNTWGWNPQDYKTLEEMAVAAINSIFEEPPSIPFDGIDFDLWEATGYTLETLESVRVSENDAQLDWGFQK